MAVSEKKYFDKNMALLKEYYPSIYDTVKQIQGAVSGVEVIRAENNKLNLEVVISETETVLIHDSADPGQEAQAFLSMVPENSTGVILMFGMGLGYSVIDLLKSRKRIQYLVLFELNPEFFVQALRYIDLAEVLIDNRLIICLENPERLDSVMGPVHKALMVENIHTLSLMTCFRVNREYEVLSPVVSDYILAFSADGNTKLSYGRTFIENRLKHLTAMHHDKKLEELEGKFKDVPALIVAAGPSLDKNIDQLHNAVGKAVIICVDSALPVLLAKNIIPDFVSSIDYQELTWEKIAGVAADPACKNINLICTTWVTDLIPKRFPAKNVYWAYSRNALETWINRIMGGAVSIGGAATVAHLNFVAAKIMGCDPIIFVGQDLAFSNQKGHSSNVVLSSDTQVKKILENDRNLLWVKGVKEPQVPTNRQMQGYRRTFERMIDESDNLVINATEGGAYIEGAEHQPLSQVVESHCNKAVMVEVEEHGPMVDLLTSIESAVSEVKKAERNEKKTEKLSRAIQKKMMNLKKGQEKIMTFSQFPEGLQRKISDLDNCHKRADDTPLFSLFDEMTLENLRQNEREQRDIDKLEGIPDKYFEWFSKSLFRIEKINKIRMENLSWFRDKLTEIVGFYKKEKLKLEQLGNNRIREKSFFDLAQLYEETGNIALLEKLMTQYQDILGKTSALHFYRGLLFLHYEAYENAENQFKKAIEYDEKYAEMIDGKRKEFAEYYWKQFQYYHKLSGGHRSFVLDKLLIKGLRIWPAHPALQNRLGQTFDRDLDDIKQAFDSNDSGKLEEAKKNLEFWHKGSYLETHLLEILGTNRFYHLYYFYGKIGVNEKNFHDALAHYEVALSLDRKNPEIYIALADTCFFSQDFDTGVAYLKQAVDLDKRYGVYWENMGDNLMQQEDYNTAILAFEQCFFALPQKMEVLKKMGECHTRLGNLEAAREALMQFKNSLTHRPPGDFK